MCASQVEDHSAETGHWIYKPHLPPLKVLFGLDYGIDVSGGVRDCQSEVESVRLQGLHHVKVTVARWPFLPRVPRVTIKTSPQVRKIWAGAPWCLSARGAINPKSFRDTFYCELCF